ncbi:Hypothetical protein NGAL_HAMBI2605_09400 [Neorhizobium galegae bv. orientalis]|nr:Hypothetical protein NGAL_HAMBI2605_09400 [Neorhizobium galegae bv. orientalis]
MSKQSELRQSVHYLGLEIRIMRSLAAYSQDAGRDNEIDDYQQERVEEAFEALSNLLQIKVTSESLSHG